MASTQKIQSLITRLENETKSGTYKGSDRFLTFSDLRRQTTSIIQNPQLITRISAITPKINQLKGKHHQIVKDQFASLFSELTYHLPETSPEDPLPDPTIEILKHTFQQLLPPPPRAEYQARIRIIYWQIIKTIGLEVILPETHPIARSTITHPRTHPLERDAALTFLLDQSTHDPDQETLKIIETLYQNPPSRETLVQILNHKVTTEELTELQALSKIDNYDDYDEEDIDDND